MDTRNVLGLYVCKDMENVILGYLEQCPRCKIYGKEIEKRYIKKCKCNFGNMCLHNFKCGSLYWDCETICDECSWYEERIIFTEHEYLEYLQKEFDREEEELDLKRQSMFQMLHQAQMNAPRNLRRRRFWYNRV